jgi:hypothetical protein
VGPAWVLRLSSAGRAAGLARVAPLVGSFAGRGPGSLAASPMRSTGLSYCWIPGDPSSNCTRAVSPPWSTARQCPAGARAVSTRWPTGRQSPSGSQAISPRLALRPLVPLRHTGRQYPLAHGPSVPHGAWPVSPRGAWTVSPRFVCGRSLLRVPITMTSPRLTRICPFRVAVKFGPFIAPVDGPRRARGPLVRVVRDTGSAAAVCRAVST